MPKQAFSIQDILNSPIGHRNQHLNLSNSKPLKPSNSGQLKKGNKYNNKKVFDEFGNEYDSKKERKRATELRLLLKAGAIGFLSKQTEFELIVNGKAVAKYIADFVYTDTKTGQLVVEDVKSSITRKLPTYRLKRKLMWQIHKIKIVEI